MISQIQPPVDHDAPSYSLLDYNSQNISPPAAIPEPCFSQHHGVRIVLYKGWTWKSLLEDIDEAFLSPLRQTGCTLNEAPRPVDQAPEADTDPHHPFPFNTGFGYQPARRFGERREDAVRIGTGIDIDPVLLDDPPIDSYDHDPGIKEVDLYSYRIERARIKPDHHRWSAY